MTGAPTGSAGGEVAGALAARDLMTQAFRSHDLHALAHLLAVDLVVNAPINRVVDRDNLFERIRRHEVHYADGPSTTNIEFAEARDDLVVIMGEEIAHPLEHTPHTGSTVRRRFTDIWRPHATTWQLAIRQATITHIDPA